MRSKSVFLILCLSMMFMATIISSESPSIKTEDSIEKLSRIVILWTSGDREVALKMVFMYTYNAKRLRWWETIRFIVWGPSSKLLAGDEELQQEIKKMKEMGIELLACKACADMYGVSDKLASLGIEVKYMGVPLTDMLKEGWVSLTF